MAHYSSISNSEAEVIPQGWLYAPARSPSPMLDLTVIPRHSIYLGSETEAEFIVDAILSFHRGQPYEAAPPGASSKRYTGEKLKFKICVDGSTVASGEIGVNTRDNVVGFFPRMQLKPRMDAYRVSLTATQAGKTYTATTSFYYLPEKDSGSVVKVDNLHRSLLYRNSFTSGKFEYVFPYGFYGDCSGYFNGTGNITAYARKGLNVVNPVCAFTDGNLTDQFDAMDANNLLFQYDMRGSFMNLTSMAEQVPLVKDHPSLLTYYTADEPDGWGYPLNSTSLAYDLLAKLDKYHPVALVLNCQNYFFPQYAAGADILMEDAYPVGINATFSYRGTPCNDTIGDCGCDNCRGLLTDVPSRVDALYEYGAWLGGAAARKPVWIVPQAFYGEGYWSRDPTAEETWVMDIMGLNHGAKGRLAWIYPATDVLDAAAEKLSRVVTVPPISNFLSQAQPTLLEDGIHGAIDAAYWTVQGRTLIGIANPNNSTNFSARLELPADIRGSDVEIVVWGNTAWEKHGSVLMSKGFFEPLGTSFIILG